MWTCENCGMENEGYVCTGCGAAYAKKQEEQAPGGRGAYFGIIATLVVLLLALVVLFAALLIMKDKEEEKEPVQIVNVVTPTAQPTAPVTDDGVNEAFEAPAEPVQTGWITETAEITGHAVVNENRTHSRRNIHLTNVKAYVDNTIRPRYNEIAAKEASLPMAGGENGITWRFADDTMAGSGDSSVACVTYEAGSYGAPYARKYYFDAATGELIFAFVFRGAEEEHRLYFYKNSIIRYINPNDEITDNPTEAFILEMADEAIREGYVNWQ